MNINDYIGKPWVSGARGPNEFDCWGLLIYVLKNEFGVEIDEEYYIHGRDTKKITRAYESAVTGPHWERQERPSEGCAVALSKNKRIHHAGVWVQDGCLHSLDHACVVHNSLSRLKINGYSRVEFYKWHK